MQRSVSDADAPRVTSSRSQAAGFSHGIGRGLVVGRVLGMTRDGLQADRLRSRPSTCWSTGFGGRNRRERALGVDTPITAVIVTTGWGPMCTRLILAGRADFPGRPAAEAAGRQAKSTIESSTAKGQGSRHVRREQPSPECTGGFQSLP